RIHAAPARMNLLRNPRRTLIGERCGDRQARRRESRDLDLHRTEREARARDHRAPVESDDRAVLARRARPDRMALEPERLDEIHRIEAERAVRPAVKSPVALMVALNAVQ